MPDPVVRLNAALEGRYRVERELGEGGMATVYLADDLKHERKVAVKVLKPELAEPRNGCGCGLGGRRGDRRPRPSLIREALVPEGRPELRSAREGEQATGDRDVDPRSDVYALGCFNCDVHPDGSRFIMVALVGEGSGGLAFSEVHPVTNGFEKLKQRFGN